MKTFINVLYRRILYKIPLKLLLILLAVFSVLFACFSSALTLDNLNYPGEFEFQISDNFYGTRNIKQYYNYTHNGISCLFVANNYCTLNDGTTTYSLQKNIAYCTDSNTIILNCSSTSDYYYYIFLGDNWLKEWYPDYTSLQCQTEYNLIPISSVDSNYCTTNNLCPSQECPDTGTGDLTQLYINNILHVGAPTILMNIPDEIDWDYAYTQGGNIMNIDVVGYNVDYQAIEDEVIIQKYKPTSDELSGIISGLIPLFVPGLCIILLLYFIFKFIKKVF